MKLGCGCAVKGPWNFCPFCGASLRTGPFARMPCKVCHVEASVPRLSICEACMRDVIATKPNSERADYYRSRLGIATDRGLPKGKP